MKKSEMIRAAAARVKAAATRRGGDRVCYCTPTREMRLSIQNVAMNELNDLGTTSVRDQLREMMSTVATKISEALNLSQSTSLDELDHDDGDIVSDEVVEEAFEKAALMYEEQGE